MGCTPSHNGIIQIIAKNATKPLQKNKSILPPNPGNNGITIPLPGNKNPDSYIQNEEIRQKDNIQESHHQTRHSQNGPSDGLSRKGSVSEEQENYEKHGTADEAMVNLSYQKRRNVRKHSSTGSEQELPATVQQEGNPRRSRKSKSQRLKNGRRAKPNQTASHEIQKKVDFPEQLVKAHQDAYAFLNPNLSKYEAVISMANQATQTHIIMQQMTSFMALRFDEIEKCLGEIAGDGEKLLKAVGGNLTWPLGKGDPTNQPDLLQQLLQYTVDKMQSLNCTVSSLTTNALQETCSFLQSAADKFQEKLKAKEYQDERLLKMIKSMEDLAAGSPPPQPNDATLYSEDSGIGGDSESMRGYRSHDKMGSQASIDSSAQVCMQKSEGIAPLQLSINENKIPDHASHLNNSSGQKENINLTSQAQVSHPRVSKQTSLASSLSMSSLASTTTLEQDGTHDQESEELTSSDESSDESEDDKSIKSQITLPQRPLTSPAGTCAYKVSSKWLENPENEEMTLKMKEAISEKIKFVPGESSTNVWTREEVNPETVRPSTADGSNRKSTRHRRSRSAESLRSQCEDPTLLELQRTQKELNKKLEQLYSSNGSKKKEMPENPSVKSFSHTATLSSSSMTSTQKLKACLDKSFNILPSQERVTVRKIDTVKDSNSTQKNKMAGTMSVRKQDVKSEVNATSAEQKLESINVSPQKSVRKLIQTFSPADDATKITVVKTLGPLRCVRKFGVPVLPPTIPACKDLRPLNNKSHILSTEEEYPSTSTLTGSFPAFMPQNDITTDTVESMAEDLENLPPPPPEILMDDSYNLLPKNEHEKNINLTCPVKMTSMSQKIKTSINIKNLLPNRKATDTYTSVDNSNRKKEPTTELRKYSLESGQQHVDRELGLDIQRKNEIEQAANLYKQSHKIIHLQNPGDGEMVRLTPNGDTDIPCLPASMPKPKQSSPTLHKNEKIPVTLRRTSPTRATASSPPTERKVTSPPANKVTNKAYSPVPRPPPVQKNISPTSTSRHSSPPAQRKVPSPPSQRKLPSPPQIRRQQSPPNQRRLPSPPQIQRQQSPPNQRRLPSPPANRFETSSPSSFTPSPPVSPSFTHKGLRRCSDDPQASSKMIGNAQSIFCPSSTSLFEAKPPSPSSPGTLESGFNKVSSPVLKHSLSSCQYGDQHRRLAMSAANPQPFVRRCYSDRRPRVQLRLPTSTPSSAVSDSALHQIGVEEAAPKDSDPGTGQTSDLRASELCVVGQGLQKD